MKDLTQIKVANYADTMSCELDPREFDGMSYKSILKEVAENKLYYDKYNNFSVLFLRFDDIDGDYLELNFTVRWENGKEIRKMITRYL